LKTILNSNEEIKAKIMNTSENCVIVIFGASGDLTKRKLVPSLFELYRKNLLPPKVAILGVGRSDYNDESFREKVNINVKLFSKSKPVNQKALRDFLKMVFYEEMDPNDAEAYEQLKKRILDLNEFIEAKGNYIFYLATPPNIYEVITANLGTQELNKQGDGEGWKRIVFEKPLSSDLESCRTLNSHIHQFFQEDQVYRIDHLLSKEGLQNIIAFRVANAIFEPLWNRNYIQRVEITAAENIGIEDRGAYYDANGALRDMVQTHLLPLMSIIAMDVPSRFEANVIRNEKIKVFHSLVPILPENVAKQVVRGQYLESTIRGEKIAAYRKEKKVEKDSKTETYVALKFFIDNWRWGGVPFYIRTGKRLPTKITEVALYFKKSPHSLFTREFPTRYNDNQLVFRINPDEGIWFKFGMKMPSAGFNIKSVNIDFHYKDLGEIEFPDPYEQLLLDCFLGDAMLFARADAVEACWSFITPILQAWKDNPDIKLYGYLAGSWGPKESFNLLEPGEEWRYLSKELVNGTESTEL
jgi:glucose-6-phosphate 1-dehydrogenase